MIIPYKSLEPLILKNIIEEFISREGSDYGDIVYSLESKVSKIEEQLSQNKVYIVYSEELDTTDIRTHSYCSSNGLL